MINKQKDDAKKRIFDAAARLFAHKGFAAVSTREIAKEANVNSSMLFYYFGKKVDILKAIINECYDKYYQIIDNIGDEITPLQERVRLMIRNLVEFFRANTEVATVSFNTLPVDIPEIVDLKIKWISGRRKAMNKMFTQFGLDTNDRVQMGVMRGFLTSVILTHFQNEYAWQHIKQAPDQSKYTQEFIKQEDDVELDNTFYESYSETLANAYLHSLSSITAKNKKKEIPR